MSETPHKVEIVEYKTGEVVGYMKARSEREAERMARGLDINLNHALYYTRTAPERVAENGANTPHAPSQADDESRQK